MLTLRCRMRLTPLNASIATATNAVKKQRQQNETGPTPTRTNENLYGPLWGTLVTINTFTNSKPKALEIEFNSSQLRIFGPLNFARPV